MLRRRLTSRRNPLLGGKRIQWHLVTRQREPFPLSREAKSKGQSCRLEHLFRVQGCEDSLRRSHARVFDVAVALVGYGAEGVVEEDGDQGHFEAED